MQQGVTQGRETDDQTSADRVAAQIRRRILEGDLLSGTPLRDAALAEDFDVSRNTVREALRTLQRERLTQYVRNRGTAVAVLDEHDIDDIYQARRALELQGIQQSLHAPAARLRDLDAAIERSEQLVRSRQWREVGTSSLDFHAAIVRTLGSVSLDAFAGATFTRLRLAFSLAADERDFQKPWIERDRHINDLIQRGDIGAAHDAMRLYLDDSQAHVRGVLRFASRATTD